MLVALIDIPVRYGRILILHALGPGYEAIIAFLIACDNAVDLKSYHISRFLARRTPVLLAAGKGRIEVAGLRLKNGAYANIKNSALILFVKGPVIEVTI